MIKNPKELLQPFLNLRIRNKFLAVILTAVFIPLIVSFVISLQYYNNSTQRFIQTALTDKSNLAELLIQSRQVSLRSAAETLSQDNLVGLNLELGLHEAIREYLVDTVASRDLTLTVVLDPQGRVLASSLPPGLIDLTPQYQLDQNRTLFLSLHRNGNPSAERVLRMNAQAPIFNSRGTLLGYVVTSYEFQQDKQLIDSFFTLLRGKLDAPFILSAGEDVIITSGLDIPEAEEALVTQAFGPDSATYPNVSVSEQRYILSRFQIDKIPESGPVWFIIAFPEGDLLMVRNQALLSLVLTIVVAGFFAIVLALYFSNIIARPITVIEEQARKVTMITASEGQSGYLSDGDDTTVQKITQELEQIRTYHDETGRLAVEFLGMVQTIKSTYIQLRKEIREHQRAEGQVRKLNYELESRVERRTQELSVANERLEDTIEDLRNAQHHLIESEKMAALGVLVAGMAHEINTPLGTSITGVSIIKNNTASLLASYNANSISKRAMEDYLQGVTEVIALIESNLARAASQISFYKRVSIDQEGESEVSFNLTSYLNDMVAALGKKLDPKRISFENNLPSPVMIESYPNIIYQVFSNLILNSIQHGFDSEMEGLISVDYQDKGDWIEIVYQDNGKGMDEQTRKHIFEPFYTTKRGQGGSGLGLSIVYSLLTGTCQGHISCESAPGEGARFIIDLPKQQAKASTAG